MTDNMKASIKNITAFLDSCSNLTKSEGDIDTYWSNNEITFMLTHTDWCAGEDNDKHKLLLWFTYDGMATGEPIVITSFTEKIKKGE